MNKKDVIVEKNKKIVNLLQDYGFSFADVSKMLRNKDVKVNGKAVKDNVQVFEGDRVTFFFSDDMLNKKFDVLYEDDDCYVIFKYAGIESAGEKGVEKILKDSIAVHRLDRNTEGVMVYAKKPSIAQKIENGIKKNKVHKHYIAEVVGEFDVKNVTFTAYLSKDADTSFVKIYKNKKEGAVLIKTKVNTIKCGKQSSLVEVELLTGKTHQIRAHLAFLGHAIIGDGKYGKNSDNKKFQETRQKLACFLLKFDDVGVAGLDNKSFKMYPKWAEKIVL